MRAQELPTFEPRRTQSMTESATQLTTERPEASLKGKARLMAVRSRNR